MYSVTYQLLFSGRRHRLSIMMS